MKIIIFGCNGMTGNYLNIYLSKFYDVISINRDTFDIEKNDYNTLEQLIKKKSNPNDIVINCNGVIPQRSSLNDTTKYILINSLFPVQLSKLCNEFNLKFIHISTNCVYSGKKGYYVESDIHDGTDIYSKSKSLGEYHNSCIIRTSIIGEEVRNKKSFLEWALSQKNKNVNGFDCLWNGITCLELSKIIYKIISQNKFWIGVRNIFSPQSCTKYEMLHIISKVYYLNLNIKKVDYQKNVTLYTEYPEINNFFEIPTITKQIKEMYKFNIYNYNNIQDGKYTILERCRFCNNELDDVFHFGNEISLAGGFLRSLRDSSHDKKYPLTLSYCQKCYTAQCKEIINTDKLFKNNYFYYSSMIPSLVKHFTNYAEELSLMFNPSETKIVEIGCNDGVLLRPLSYLGFDVIGIDPSSTVTQLIEDGFNIYNDYFNDEIVEQIIKKQGKCDVFLSSNSFAHIHDMKSFLKSMQKILKPNGIAIIEVHYLKEIIDNMNFDFIYHEHMSYYSVSSFYEISKLYGMSISDVKFIKTHSGSIRIFLKNCISNNISPKVKRILDSEKSLRDINTFKNFTLDIMKWKENFLNLIDSLKYKKIYGYGASGRSNTIYSFLKLNLEYIIDDAKSKIGSFIPLFHVPIVDKKILKNNKPDYIIILAWPYAKSIIKNNMNYFDQGGKFIIPLPEIQIIDKKNITEFINT